MRLGPLVQNVLSDLQRDIERLGIEVEVTAAEDVEVVSDARLVARVVSNLVENAVKYNREGGTVTLEAERTENGVTVVVADSGIGIPARDLGAVFQRFYRVDSARTPGRGGLGLGLAIVKHLVDRLGGTVQLESREGVGTTVTVEIPDLG